MTTTARARPGPAGEKSAEKMQAELTAAEVNRIPRDESAEAAVIGSMLIDPEVIGPVSQIVTRETFFAEENQIVFQVIMDLWEKNTPIDALILHRTLDARKQLQQIGGIKYVKMLANAVPTSAHAEYYAVLIREAWIKRRLITVATGTLRDCYDSADNSQVILDRAEQRTFDLAQDKIKAKATERVGDGLEEAIEMALAREEGVFNGLPTGLVQLDDIVCGMQRGEVVVLAARPSVGKTALALGVIEHISIDLGKYVGLLSMEMNKQSIGQRMVCARASVDSYRLRTGRTDMLDRQRMAVAVKEIAEAGIFIDDTPAMTPMGVRTVARRMVRNQDIEFLVIDYLQLMQPGKRIENRQQEVTYISACIKALARELNIPVMLLSQLNRASESEQRRPRSSDLRESGSIEQDADVVILLHREAMMHRGDKQWIDANPDKLCLAEAIVSKNRNGKCADIPLTFLDKETRFVNYNPGV